MELAGRNLLRLLMGARRRRGLAPGGHGPLPIFFRARRLLDLRFRRRTFPACAEVDHRLVAPEPSIREAPLDALKPLFKRPKELVFRDKSGKPAAILGIEPVRTIAHLIKGAVQGAGKNLIVAIFLRPGDTFADVIQGAFHNAILNVFLRRARHSERAGIIFDATHRSECGKHQDRVAIGKRPELFMRRDVRLFADRSSFDLLRRTSLREDTVRDLCLLNATAPGANQHQKRIVIVGRTNERLPVLIARCNLEDAVAARRLHFDRQESLPAAGFAVAKPQSLVAPRRSSI